MGAPRGAEEAFAREERGTLRNAVLLFVVGAILALLLPGGSSAR